MPPLPWTPGRWLNYCPEKSGALWGDIHTNSIESFCAPFKPGFHGTFHRMSPKHLQRYPNEFVDRHNMRDKDTIDQMRDIVCGLVGKRLMYRDLIAD